MCPERATVVTGEKSTLADGRSSTITRRRRSQSPSCGSPFRLPAHQWTPMEGRPRDPREHQSMLGGPDERGQPKEIVMGACKPSVETPSHGSTRLSTSDDRGSDPARVVMSTAVGLQHELVQARVLQREVAKPRQRAPSSSARSAASCAATFVAIVNWSNPRSTTAASRWSRSGKSRRTDGAAMPT
jgi:hypothetical protein